MNVIVETLVNDSYKLLEFLYDNQTTVLDETFVPIKQDRMAKELGVTRATISSLLKKLKENGLIEDYSKDKKYKLTSDGIRCVKLIRKL